MFEHSSRVSSRIIALNTCTYNRRPMLHRQNGSLAQGGAMRRNPGRVTLACKAAAVNSQVKGVVITGGAKGLGYAMARSAGVLLGATMACRHIKRSVMLSELFKAPRRSYNA